MSVDCRSHAAFRAEHEFEEGPLGDDRTEVRFSLVVPVYNEDSCIESTITEALDAARALGHPFELIAVDDGSTDRTASVLRSLVPRTPELRVLTLPRNCGQSAAFGAGFTVARGAYVVTMDADGQNDPRDIGPLLRAMSDSDCCCGIRTNRRDTWAKRAASRVANAARRALVHDGVIDTGCSLRAMRADFARRLPMHLRGMHRFIPALLGMWGARITQIEVGHRARLSGKSKYTNLGRLRVTVRDVLMVRWMQRRASIATASEIGREVARETAPCAGRR
ncbi:glycosyltransferase family 2 protein [Opitutales bacterium ASA1]|uniref:glycosyltransferase family 2 protein n=1 Tax=Congregicoccus parvus TaxID=3081749 RepID=UPI002B2D9510|nr:glycosyltransferase family 2 protein [Opitutales bacterium ASA1]